MKEVAVKKDDYRVWWCLLFAVFIGGVVVCNDPFNIALWCPAYSGSELGVCASGPWTNSDLAFFFCRLCSFCVSHSLVSLYVALLCFYFYIYIPGLDSFSGCPTMRSSGTHTTSSSSSTSYSWCTWSGKSPRWSCWRQRKTYVCVVLCMGFISAWVTVGTFSLHLNHYLQDRDKGLLHRERQQILETPTDADGDNTHFIFTFSSSIILKTPFIQYTNHATFSKHTKSLLFLVLTGEREFFPVNSLLNFARSHSAVTSAGFACTRLLSLCTVVAFFCDVLFSAVEL